MGVSLNSSSGQKNEKDAHIDLGDQFIALQKRRKQSADDSRHFGLVVDDKETTRRAPQSAGVEQIEDLFLTSAIRGAIPSRLLIMRIFSSRRRPMFCAVWVLRGPYNS